jgi:hypothetical protein
MRVSECARYYYANGLGIYVERLEGRTDWTATLQTHLGDLEFRAPTALAAVRDAQDEAGLRGRRRLTGRRAPVILPGERTPTRPRRVTMGWRSTP